MARKKFDGALAALLLQVALGAWVSTNYAVLVCDSFPACQGSFWPDMSFAQGFQIWRPLGYTAWGELLSFSALTAIHYVHRLAAYGVIACLLAMAWWLHQRQLRGHAKALALLVLMQFLSGLSNVVLGWPLPAALLHTGGAAAMLVVLVLLQWAMIEYIDPLMMPPGVSGKVLRTSSQRCSSETLPVPSGSAAKKLDKRASCKGTAQGSAK